MLHPPAIDARESAILTRAIQPNRRDMSATAARALLRIQLHAHDRERLHELLGKNQDDTLTAEERSELDSYLHIGLLIDLLQAKARAVLRPRARPVARKNGGGACPPCLAACPLDERPEKTYRAGLGLSSVTSCHSAGA
jgi:hypothetical protein